MEMQLVGASGHCNTPATDHLTKSIQLAEKYTNIDESQWVTLKPKIVEGA